MPSNDAREHDRETSMGREVPISKNAARADKTLSTALLVNSKEYWNTRFKGDWQAKGGREQTAFFARVALTSSPAWLIDHIKDSNLSICDWGCAVGDAVHAFGQAFPNSAIVGYDFSEVAIAEGQRLFPGIRLVPCDLLDSTERFDVIFSSNTLEHFSRPQEVLETLSTHARQYIWLLVPFLDGSGMEEHFARFDHENVLKRVGDGFTLCYFREFDVSSWAESRWSGRQAVLVYARTQQLSRLARRAGNPAVQESYVSFSTATATRRLAEQDLARRAALHRLDALEADVAGKAEGLARLSALVLNAERQTVHLEKLRDERTRDVDFLKGELTNARAYIQQLQNSLSASESERASAIQFLKSEVELAQHRVRELENAVHHREEKVHRLDALEADVAGKAEELARLSALVLNAERQTVHLEKLLDERTRDVDFLKGELTNARGYIQQLQNSLSAIESERASAIQFLKSEVELAQHRVRELENAVHHREEKVRQSEATFAFLEGRLTAAEADRQELRTALQQRDSSVGHLEEQLASFRTALAAAHAEYAALQSELGGAQERLHDGAVETTQLHAKLAEHEAVGARQASEMALLRSYSTHLASELQRKVSTLDAIQASLSWRATAFLRRAAHRFPSLSHRSRQLIKIVWWTMTLQLVPRVRRSFRVRRELRILSASPLMDGAWYTARNPDVDESGLSPAEHYLLFGAPRGRDPGPLFDTNWYMKQNRDLKKTGENPLVHYMTKGAHRGCNPNPFFDSAWYLAQHPAIRDSGLDPLTYYLRHGAAAGHDPSEQFSIGWYLDRYPDVTRNGIEPLSHFLEYGRREGRMPTEPVLRLNTPKSGNGTYDIVVLANIAWNARFQRPQQLATHLSRQGRRVFYLLAHPLAGRPDLAYEIEEVASGVHQVRFAPDCAFDHYSTVLAQPVLERYLSALEDLKREWQISDAVVHVHLPSWTELALALRDRYLWSVIYDCMDDWTGFPGIGWNLIAAEKHLVETADATVVTGDLLARKWHAHTARCEIVRNGVDAEFFAKNCVENRDFAFAHPVIGYYGAIAEWVDVALLAQLVEDHPEWQFVLAGDVFVQDLCGLDKRANVKLLGLRPFGEMPKLLWHFDVCLIPFKLNTVTHAVDPVKLYEFLSAGKPVVAVPLKEIQCYADVVTFAEGADGFAHAIARALHQTEPELAARRREVARANQWYDRCASLHRLTVKLYPRISMVMVSYNTAQVTALSIGSILANTTHADYELIVVDNNSSDGSLELLKDIEREHSNVHIVSNAQNLGFAAALNHGLRAASGEILMLLNSDIVVPRGWLTGMLRALRDPVVGLAGPVTNAIGNEARIDVPYDDLAAMSSFADQWTASHRADVFELRVAAMFCVAMRRDAFEKIGPLDEEYGIGWFEDDDYSNRARAAGYTVVCTQESFVHHMSQMSFQQLDPTEKTELWERNRKYYESKWGAWVPHNPRRQ